MKFSEFLAEVSTLLEQPDDRVRNLARACQKFERQVYLAQGSLSSGAYREFYTIFLSGLTSLGPESFQGLDGHACSLLHRNLDVAMEILPESSSCIAKISTLVPEI